jgi:hypothetical protein
MASMTKGITSKMQVQGQRTHKVRPDAGKGSSWPEHDAREDVYKAWREKRYESTRFYISIYIPAAAAVYLLRSVVN